MKRTQLLQVHCKDEVRSSSSTEMVLLSVSLMSSARFFSRPLNLTRSLLQKPPIIYKKTTQCVYLRNGPPVSFYTNGRTVCLRTTSLLHPGLVLTRDGLHFHTSAPVRAFPAPFLWLLLKPLQKITAIILGRSIRKWWVALPANRRQLLRDWTWQRRWYLAAGTGVTMVIVVLLLLTHLDESPVTGRTRLLVVKREKFMELAALMSEAYTEDFKELMVPASDPRHQTVERVVQHIVNRNKDIPEVCDVPWNVHVVQSPDVNAFVLPNGEVFMFTGMLEAVADVHQLAFVLGHEMAHALLGHAAEQASMSHIVDLLSLILLMAIWAVCPQDSLALLGQWVQNQVTELMFDLPYSRKLETEADEVGLQLAAKACADVRAGPVFWQQMEIREQLTGEPDLPEWLSTHPSHRNRYTQLDRLVPQALELRESCDCPTLPATDPRAVFSQSVRVLLENAKKQPRGETEGAQKRPLPRIAASPLPPALSATLLAPSAPPAPLPRASTDDCQESKVEVALPPPAEEGGSKQEGESTC